MVSDWIEYLDSCKHPELIAGKKYCVKTLDGCECYAKFVVYEGGQEVAFISLNDNQPITVCEFRLIDKETDLQPTT